MNKDDQIRVQLSDLPVSIAEPVMERFCSCMPGKGPDGITEERMPEHVNYAT
jgi:hypothetical protein